MPPKPDPLDISKNWKAHLLKYNQSGDGPAHYKGNLANAVHALDYAPELRKCVAYNSFTDQFLVLRRMPWGSNSGSDWGEQDTRQLCVWLQNEGIEVSPATTWDAVQTVAERETVNPLTDYLTRLEWDGEQRLDTFLAHYFGAEHSEYTRFVGRKWCVSAIYRALEPGHQADYTIVLEGGGGIGKSTGLKALAGAEFFTDYTPENLRSRDTPINLRGKWIIEFSELEGLLSRYVEDDAAKSFLSKTHDRYRPVHGKHVIEVPRQYIFAATTNKTYYLRDETGNRRYWPVRCGKRVRVDGLARDRDQIWAEALNVYTKHEPIYPNAAETELATVEQNKRMERDPWTDRILDFIGTKLEVSTSEILVRCLEFAHKDCTAPRRGRVLRVLAMAGFKEETVSKGPQRGRIVYRREP